MEKKTPNSYWHPALSFCLVLAIFFSPVSLSAKEIQVEHAADMSRNSFLKQDEVGTSNPFQVQVMISAGGCHSCCSINMGAAIHLGYRVSELLYLGWTSEAIYNYSDSVDNDNYRYDDATIYGQEGAKEIIVRTDPRHLLEMRFFPWQFGLYFSTGIMHFGHDKIITEFKNRPRIINENAYTTGMTTTLEYKEWTGAAAGIGFNHIFNNGFSLGGGITTGLTIQDPEITIVTDTTVAAVDLAEWHDQIKNNEKRLPMMFHFGVGYAF